MKHKGNNWILLALPLMGLMGCRTLSVSKDCDCSPGLGRIGTSINELGMNIVARSHKLGFGENTLGNCSTCETTSEFMGPKTPLSLGKVREGKIIEGKVIESKPRNQSNPVVVPDEVRKPLPSRDE